jgi:hypothetical protein
MIGVAERPAQVVQGGGDLVLIGAQGSLMYSQGALQDRPGRGRVPGIY